MFRAFAAGDRTAIHPNLRGSVYAIALQNGGTTEYEVLLAEYRTARDADERNTALRALGRIRAAVHPDLVHRTLALPLSDAVKSQDVYIPLTGLRTEAAGVEALFTWLTSNWDSVQAKCPPGLSMLSTLVTVCTAGFTTEAQADRVRQFFADKERKGFQMALQQSLDSIRAKAGWIERDAGDVKAYLVEHGYLDKGKL